MTGSHATSEVNPSPKKRRVNWEKLLKVVNYKEVNKWRIIIISYLLVQRFLYVLSLDVITSKKQDICKSLSY